MAADVGIDIEVTSKGGGAKRVKRDLDAIATSGDKATNSTKKLENQLESTSRATENMKKAVLGLMAAFGVRELVRFSDNIVTLQTQLKNVSKDTAQYTRNFDALFKIAQSTGDAFGGLTSNFVQLNSSLPDAIRNTTNLTKVTELLSRGFAASGANAQTAGAVMTQLTQGLAGNFANAAQEINSMIEGAPLLAKIIAEQLGGKAATDLKKFAQEGKLTTESFLQALLAAEEAIKSYAIPPTISRSIERVQNAFKKMGSESRVLESAAGGLASAFDALAANLDTIIKLIGVAAGATIPLLIKQFSTALPLAIAVTTTAINTLTAAMAANPFGAIAVAISALISAFFLFRKEIFSALDDVEVFGIDVTNTMFLIKNTAVDIFGNLAAILMAPFKAAMKFFQSTAAEARILANRFGANFDITQKDRALSELNTFNIVGGEINSVLSRVGGSKERILEATNKDIEEFAKRFKEVEEPAKTVVEELGKVNEETEILAAAVGSGGVLSNAFKGFTEEIDRDFSRAFKDAFSGAGNGFEGLIDGMKASFIDMLGELVYQAAARPIMLSIGGSFSGGAGGSGGGVGGVSGGLGNISSLSSLLTGGSMSAPIFGGSSFVGQGINSIGSAFGIGGGVGPSLPGSTFSGLSNAFTPAASLGGFGGNLLGNAVFGSDRGVGASIGGTVGGIAGTAIAGGSAAMMATLGAAAGPIGALAGSFLGNALGGMFGGKPSNKSAGGFIDPNTGSVFGVETPKGDDNLPLFNRASQAISEALTFIKGAAGGEFTSGTANVAVGSRDPFFAQFGDNKLNFNTEEELIFGTIDHIVESMVGASEEFADIVADAGRLTGEEIVEAFQKRVAKIDFITAIESELLKLTDPVKFAVDAEQKAADERLRIAKELGADLTAVEQLNAIKLRDARSNGFDVSNQLQNSLTSFLTSDKSFLSTQEKFGFAKSNFNRIAASALAGDTDAASQAFSAADAAMSLNRQINASSPAGVAEFNFIRDTLEQITDLNSPDQIEKQTQDLIALGERQITNDAANTQEIKQAIDNLAAALLASPPVYTPSGGRS